MVKNSEFWKDYDGPKCACGAPIHEGQCVIDFDWLVGTLLLLVIFGPAFLIGLLYYIFH